MLIICIVEVVEVVEAKILPFHRTKKRKKKAPTFAGRGFHIPMIMTYLELKTVCFRCFFGVVQAIGAHRLHVQVDVVGFHQRGVVEA